MAIFFRLVTHAMGKLGEKATGIDVVDALKKDVEEFEKFRKKAQDEAKGHWDLLNEFINEAIELKGSIYEDNLTTQIIRVNIRLLKEESSKENVLIIDNLDRLDPEHIFRILNILSAHNDHFGENKFSFDKVIVVCDRSNIPPSSTGSAHIMESILGIANFTIDFSAFDILNSLYILSVAFYRVQQYENPRGVGNIAPPHISFLGKSTVLALAWNSSNRYPGAIIFSRLILPLFCNN